MNPYEILGISPGASEDDIRKAYRKMAMEWHPDRRGGSKEAEERFKEINTAYQILTGKAKSTQESSRPGFPGFSDEEVFEFFSNGGSGFSFGDIFASFMGGRAQNSLSLHISLEDACAGGRKNVRFMKRGKCPDCAGVGRVVHVEPCPSCGGSGRTQVTSRTSTVFTITTPCPVCVGTGKKLGGPCHGACRGARVVSTQHETTIDIPPGVGDGETLVAADGSKVVIHHMEHPVFKTVPGSLNTESEMETSLFDLMLGGEAVVPTLVGEMRVKIEPGLRPGSRLRIHGAGMLNRRGNRGDHVVRVWARMPKLTENHQRTLREMRVEIEGEPNV